MEAYATSENLEVQGRACEYKRTFGHDTIRSQLFEHMPALDESTYTRHATQACSPVDACSLLRCAYRTSHPTWSLAHTSHARS